MTVLAAVFTAIAAWWLATGVVIVLARQGDRRFGMVMALVTLIAFAGLAGLAFTLDGKTTASAYAAFFSALALWAWHETTFLIGLVTGPRRIGIADLPVETSRFRAAFLTVRDHELALAATAIAMLLFMHDADNKTGLMTFLLLWVMRISTKLNIFMGAQYAVSDMLPERLAYLKSYFRTDRTSRWFYVSLTGSFLLFSYLVVLVSGSQTSHDTVKWSLLATFAGLALVEHLFLVLPVKDSALWSWAMARSEAKKDKDRDTAALSPTKPTLENPRATARA